MRRKETTHGRPADRRPRRRVPATSTRRRRTSTTLVAAVKAKTVRIEGAILVTHDTDGNVVVQQTGDHLGPQGRGLGRRGRLPRGPRRAAAAGGDRRRRRRRRDRRQASRSTRWRPASTTRSARRSSRARPPSSRCSTSDQHLAVEQALAGRAGAVGRPDRQVGHGRAEGLARRGDGQVQPRTGPSCRSRTARFGGSIGRTMDASVGDWSMIPGPKAPEGAPNVLHRPRRRRRLRRPRDVRRRDPHAEPDARPADGPDLQPLPRDGRLLADARRAPHRAQPPPRGHGRHRGVPRPVPGLHGDRGRGAARPCRGSSRRTATSPAASASGT